VIAAKYWGIRTAMQPTEDPDPSKLTACLERLAAGDLLARDTIIELCAERLRVLAHRMLSRFPNVRRWDDTDDVFQNAAMRLHRALGQMSIESPRSVMALAATQIQRELIDLARRLGLETVAEWVQDEESAAILADWGAVLGVNLHGVIHHVHHLGPAMA
jgi:DNA-directed RNA polymerase specialized sigma24 family protein